MLKGKKNWVIIKGFVIGMKIIYVRQNHVAALAWTWDVIWAQHLGRIGLKITTSFDESSDVKSLIAKLSSLPTQLIIYSLHSPVNNQIPSISSEGNTVNSVIEFGFEYVRLTVLWEPTKAEPGFGLWSWDCTTTRWPQHLCGRVWSSRFQVCYSSHFWRFW